VLTAADTLRVLSTRMRGRVVMLRVVLGGFGTRAQGQARTNREAEQASCSKPMQGQRKKKTDIAIDTDPLGGQNLPQRGFERARGRSEGCDEVIYQPCLRSFWEHC